jgi:2-haloacid dehalogenase
MYDLVLIDADETLFDFRRAESQALAQTFGQFGLEPSESLLANYHEINGKLWNQLERGELDQEKLKSERFRLLFERIGAGVDGQEFSRVYIERLSKGIYLLEHAESVCEYLGARYTVAIITNGIREVQLARINDSAIRKYIDCIVISEEAGSRKPDSGIFEYACRMTGIRDKAKMIIVGDSLSSDIKGGLDFGIDTCWIRPASTKNETAIVPKYEIESLLELERLL